MLGLNDLHKCSDAETGSNGYCGECMEDLDEDGCCPNCEYDEDLEAVGDGDEET
jgi:hypothetical protein